MEWRSRRKRSRGAGPIQTVWMHVLQWSRSMWTTSWGNDDGSWTWGFSSPCDGARRRRVGGAQLMSLVLRPLTWLVASSDPRSREAVKAPRSRGPGSHCASVRVTRTSSRFCRLPLPFGTPGRQAPHYTADICCSVRVRPMIAYSRKCVLVQ